MGNHKFRLSDILPNAWFYKLRDMGSRRSRKKTRNSGRVPHQFPKQIPPSSRKSHHFIPDPITPNSSDPHSHDSTKRKPHRDSIYRASNPERIFDGFQRVLEFDLPPILTKKPVKNRGNAAVTDSVKFSTNQSEMEETKARKSLSLREDRDLMGHKAAKPISPARKNSVSGNSPRLKLRPHSPRIGSRKIQAACGRKSCSYYSGKVKSRRFSGSLAMVKSSIDPQKDFRQSMEEMVVENNLRSAKDLEELLACYLSLNSDVYHDLIVKAFEEIWFCFANYRK